MEEFNKSIILNVKRLSKVYKLFNSPKERLRYQLFGGNIGRDFVALNDLNFDVKRGESFAIVGKNGSGKSTLLQILAGIIKPTSGDVCVKGKVAALLELGSGFDPELTGYDNIFMNAAILGLNKEEIRKKAQDIIDFADIGEYLYQPVKTYSSGMFIRLGFAIAINVDAEILLIDEALAVGDIFFRQKCYNKLNQLKEKGITIILVTHNMTEAEQFCDRALLISKGKQYLIGKSSDVVKEYYLLNQEGEQEKLDSAKKLQNYKVSSIKGKMKFWNGWEIKEEKYYDLSFSKEITNGKGEFLKIGLFGADGSAKRNFEQGEWAYFYIEIKVLENIEVPFLGIIFYNQMNICVHGKDTLQTDAKLPFSVNSGTTLFFLQKFKLDIAVGEYSFEAGFGSIDVETYKNRNKLLQEELDLNMERICVRNSIGSFSIVLKSNGAPTRMGFHGNCDLLSDTEVKIQN